MVAGLIAQNPQRVFDATVLAVYLHGLAGDFAMSTLGENSLVATDLLQYLPEAFADARKTSGAEVRLQGRRPALPDHLGI
jgi:NAD(P)H-hydrate epimerase